MFSLNIVGTDKLPLSAYEDSILRPLVSEAITPSFPKPDVKMHNLYNSVED